MNKFALLNIYNNRILNKGLNLHFPNLIRRLCTQKIVTEQQIRNLLEKKFPSSQAIQVEDVSGGCGAMFNIYIESSDFKGLSIPKQHKMVYETLQEQIKNIHGLHLETKIPK